MRTEVLAIAADHPALPGHFPARPIVPGVVLLDQAQLQIEAATGVRVCGVAMAKFVSPAGPEDVLTLDYESSAESVRFEIRTADRKIAAGRFALGVVS
jgi:3-hydroxyacyl-[acyl-carrier-protein] dehydratase